MPFSFLKFPPVLALIISVRSPMVRHAHVKSGNVLEKVMCLFLTYGSLSDFNQCFSSPVFSSIFIFFLTSVAALSLFRSTHRTQRKGLTEMIMINTWDLFTAIPFKSNGIDCVCFSLVAFSKINGVIIFKRRKWTPRMSWYRMMQVF